MGLPREWHCSFRPIVSLIPWLRFATQCNGDLITYESGDCTYGAALGVLELIANFVVPERPYESARVCMQSQLIVSPVCVFHHFRRRSVIQQLPPHEFHVGRDMMKEFLVGRAEIIESGLAVRRGHKAMFGAFSIARKANIAIAAESRQRIALGPAKGQLLFHSRQRSHSVLHDVAELVFRINVMITGIQVSLMFKGQSVAAGLGKNAQTWLHAQPELERDIKKLNKAFGDIVSDPLVKNGAEEVSENFRLH